MPNFNPSVPATQDPNWLGWSKAISQPEGNKALGQLFKGVGDVFSQGVKSADEYVQETAKNAVAARAQPIVDENQEALTALDTSLKEGRPLTQQDLMDKNQQNAPAGVDRAVDKMQMLEKGKANGKFSETHYYGELYRVLKDIRSQFPGYRQYVDQEMERITGKNVANAYMSSMLSDINSYVTNQQKDKDEIRHDFNEAMKEGVKLEGRYAAQDMTEWLNGNMSDTEARYRINRYNENKYRFQELERSAKAPGLEREQASLQAKEYTSEYIGYLSHLNQQRLAPYADEVNAAVAGLKSGQQIDPERHQAIVSQIQMMKKEYENQFDLAMRTKQYNGHNLSYYHTAQEANDLKKEFGNQFDYLTDLANNKDYGTIHNALNMAKAIESRDKLNLLKDSTMGGYLRLNSQLKDVSPVLQKQLNDWALDRNLGKDGMPLWVQQKVGEFSTGNPGSTLTKSLQDLAGEKKASPEVKARTADELINWTVRATDPSIGDTARLNLVKSAIGLPNLELMKQYTAGGPQEKAFNSLTSPQFVKTVKELDAKSPGLMNSYKEWTLHSMGILLGNEFIKLRDREEMKGSVGWDDGTTNGGYPHFVDKKYTPTGWGKGAVERASPLTPINQALRNAAELAKVNNENPNEFILKGLQAVQALNPDTMQGLPQEMYDTVTKHREAQKKFEEQKAAMTKKKDQSKP